MKNKDQKSSFNNRNSFREILKEFNISKEQTCIIGSTVLYYFDIRENRDVDFVCTYDARQQIHNQVRSHDNYQINSGGNVKFGDNKVGLTRTNRFGMFGISDDKIVNNPKYHFIVDGFKILRPELELSIKRYRGNDKDKQDIKLIKKHLIGCEEWDWDLVQVVPPWYGERGDLVTNARDILQYEGLVRLLRRSIVYFLTNIVQNYSPKKKELFKSVPFYEPHRYREGLKTIDATELFSFQYNDNGQFVREDIIPALLALEGDLEFDDGHTDETNRDSVVISRDGEVVEGVWALASIIKEATNDGMCPLPDNLDITVSVSSGERLPNRTKEWVESRFNAEEIKKIRQQRQELFQSMGLIFYSFLWPAAREHFDEIEDRLAEIGRNLQTTEFEHLTGFDEMVIDIYTSDKRTDDWRIQKKIHELNKYDQVFRVVSFELPSPEFRPNETPKISSKTHKLKYSCRKDLQSEIDDYVFDIILHVTDNYRQNVHVTKVLDSIENGEYTGLEDYSG